MLRSPPTSPVDLLHVLSTPRAASASSLSLSLLWSWNYRTAPLHAFSRHSGFESLDFICSVPPKVRIRRTHLEFVVFTAKFEVPRSRFFVFSKNLGYEEPFWRMLLLLLLLLLFPCVWFCLIFILVNLFMHSGFWEIGNL